MNKLSRQAFTLIELLVVIAIIGILSGLIVVSTGGMTQKATIAKAQAFSNSLRNALMLNLVSEWKFDGSGVNDGVTATTAYTQDSWNGGNNCTINGAPLVRSGSNCVSGSCLSFNTSADYLSCGNASNLNLPSSFTISAWIYKAAFNSTYEQVVAKTDSVGAGGYEFGVMSNKTLYITNGPTTKNSSTLLSVNAWYYATVTYNGTAVHFYLNGVSDSNDFVLTLPASSSNVGIGRAADRNTSLNFVGRIDDVRIFNTSMPVSRIKEDYYMGLNDLFIGGGITKEEYLSKISNYAKN